MGAFGVARAECYTRLARAFVYHFGCGWCIKEARAKVIIQTLLI